LEQVAVLHRAQTSGFSSVLQHYRTAWHCFRTRPLRDKKKATTTNDEKSNNWWWLPPRPVRASFLPNRKKSLTIVQAEKHARGTRAHTYAFNTGMSITYKHTH
jgi:hypothetical protein